MKEENELTEKIMKRVVKHEERSLVLGLSEWGGLGLVLAVLMILGIGDVIAQINEIEDGEWWINFKKVLLADIRLSKVFVWFLLFVLVVVVVVTKTISARNKLKGIRKYQNREN